MGHEIVLRPRFTIDLTISHLEAIQSFEHARHHVQSLVVRCMDHHVFIKIPKSKQHFWSPQLDLEIIEADNNKAVLKGLFGPKPAVWTLFMFAHFLVGTLFLGMGVWAYSNYSLDRSYALQVLGIGFTLLLWFVLYFAGRMGKSAGRKEMILQYQFMQQTLKLYLL